ncbi:hypothetical protein B0H14DRAFT_2395641 [Mycena olivaceomarginata]|nr:hypothetical protein B0H14DRAFT_2395641 [Mycena olivaceomarginata]
MRQTNMSVEDIKFRSALSNMRYGACTPDDIDFLRTRQISKRPGHPSFEDPRFQNVSLITAWNSQKDQVNEMGCVKFAEETGQQLTCFYAEDTLAENTGTNERASRTDKKKNVVPARKALTERQKMNLWEAPACMSDNIPGHLRLCVGLPVMIRNNEATELCITKGQEATVVGWQEAKGSSKQTILDTLFVELTNPPKTIQIPGLPENVVALAKNPTKIWASLPDDMTVNISRQQVPVLPNFAMTDYSSQGKTRPLNVCDLTNCHGIIRTHSYSYYTSLSRGTSADGTVILQGFDTSLITSGISGFLRQEFRELELLNEITRLRYEGKLPEEVSGSDRIELLRSYQQYRGGEYDPMDIHTAIKWRKGDEPRSPGNVKKSRWQLVGKDVPKQKSKATTGNKRKQPEKPNSQVKRAKKDTEIGPMATKWDPVDYSCSYDALFAPLYDVWQVHTPKWTERFQKSTRYLACLADGFNDYKSKANTLESARDCVRALLHAKSPGNFPQGQALVALDILASEVLEVMTGELGQPSADNVIIYKKHYAISHWLAAQKIRKANRTCPECGNGMLDIMGLDVVPDMLFLSLDDPKIVLDPVIHLVAGDIRQRYALRGIIYAGENHFTSRIIKENGAIWYHDGIATGRKCQYDGQLHSLPPMAVNTCITDDVTRDVVGVLYAKSEYI